MAQRKSRGVWDASDCAVLFMDYQENILGQVREQDSRIIELNARTLAAAAVKFGIPVVLSTVGVQMGVNGPTIASLRAALAHVEDIDRSSTNAWEDPTFLAAVKATGRKRLVMAGLVTSICLAFPVVDALADGLEVCFVEDAVGDLHKHLHDTAVLRLAHAGAVANSTIAVITEWFRDWKSPLATQAREIIVPYLQAITALERAPEFRQPRGVPVKSASR